MDMVVVVDMQVGLLDGAPKRDLYGVIERINMVTEMVRGRSGRVVWIRHCGKRGDGFERGAKGWEFLPELVRKQDDIVIEKTLNDPFVGTPLKETLAQLAPDRILVAGWATDFCVDATVRSAISLGHDVVVVADGHTLSDRPHLGASAVIEHHNWVWSGLLTNRSIRVATTDQLISESPTLEPLR
ncbi:MULTISPECIES: isochorismatase family protein [Bradyrhizobium]|uniref:isochorismatase family protein n=1 Tax=Bradyrhizobium TaxID=374 RepID=UPI000485424D|nr:MULTISPECIES: isochorismatase family protein [Bradyrhizobium]QOG22713.1 isochorismatase family protein [Bradyrhizobium sp. SEMIA]UFW50247.1 isochorismatase family protein [Bradyrhizobium arachidis]